MDESNKLKFGFLLPSVFLVLALAIYPLIYSLSISLTSWRIGMSPIFIGVSNYYKLFHDADFWNVFWRTIVFVVITLFIEVSLGILLALLFNKPVRRIRALRIIRGLVIIPFFTTPAAIGLLGVTIFNLKGPLNSFLSLVGLGKLPWLGIPNLAFLCIILIDIWRWTPFCFIIILAGLQGLPLDIYQAASLETNSSLKLLRYITLPLLSPIITLVLFFKIIESFKVFDVIFSLTGGGPGRATEIISIFTYRIALRQFNLGYASANAYVLFAIIVVVVMVFFKRRLRQIIGS